MKYDVTITVEGGEIVEIGKPRLVGADAAPDPTPDDLRRITNAKRHWVEVWEGCGSPMHGETPSLGVDEALAWFMREIWSTEDYSKRMAAAKSGPFKLLVEAGVLVADEFGTSISCDEWLREVKPVGRAAGFGGLEFGGKTDEN